MNIKKLTARFARSRFFSKLGRGKSLSNRDIFRDIYQSNLWGNKDSRSGAGSDLTQTVEVRRLLPLLIDDLGVKTMLDIPCGDWHWMKDTRFPVDYTGADIVPELVERNQQLYGNETCRFLALDLIKDDLPKVDLVLSRDVLVHLSFNDILAALHNLKRSGSEYFLTTTFTDRAINPDIPTGQWRPLNLQKPPFNFPQPLRLINEKCTEGDGSWGDKSLGLWKLADIVITP
jgi:hypothetical protein